MDQNTSDKLLVVEDWRDVPSFSSEDQEAEFWLTHSLGGHALESLGTLDDPALPPPRLRKQKFWRRLHAGSHASVKPNSEPVIVDGHARLSRARLPYAS
jgi:hypothetical protein